MSVFKFQTPKARFRFRYRNRDGLLRLIGDVWASPNSKLTLDDLDALHKLIMQLVPDG